MELCTGGELFDLLYDQPDCKFNEPQCAKLATKMLGAVNYLHSMDICHRDLKLENFIFTEKWSNGGEIKMHLHNFLLELACRALKVSVGTFLGARSSCSCSCRCRGRGRSCSCRGRSRSRTRGEEGG